MQRLPFDQRQDVVYWHNYRHDRNLGTWGSMYRQGVASEVVSTVRLLTLYRLTTRECRATQLVIIRPYLSAWLCLEMALDIVICGMYSHLIFLQARTNSDIGVLIYTLGRSRSGFSRSDTIIRRLTRAAVQTGQFSPTGRLLGIYRRNVFFQGALLESSLW